MLTADRLAAESLGSIFRPTANYDAEATPRIERGAESLRSTQIKRTGNQGNRKDTDVASRGRNCLTFHEKEKPRGAGVVSIHRKTTCLIGFALTSVPGASTVAISQIVPTRCWSLSFPRRSKSTAFRLKSPNLVPIMSNSVVVAVHAGFLKIPHRPLKSSFVNFSPVWMCSRVSVVTGQPLHKSHDGRL